MLKRYEVRTPTIPWHAFSVEATNEQEALELGVRAALRAWRAYAIQCSKVREKAT